MISRPKQLDKFYFYEFLLIGLGILLGVLFSQFELIEVDFKISLGDVLIFLLTSLVALYIGNNISRGLSRIQSIKALFQEDVKSIVNYCATLELWIDSGQLPFSDVLSHMKNGNIKLRSLHKIYANRKNEINTSNIGQITALYNTLKHEITGATYSNGSVILTPSEITSFRNKLEDIKCALLNAIIEA